jgi:acetylornithine/succinyldiaminopimelate/putrescine aminotransferase
VYSALKNLHRVCAEADLDLTHETVAVIGVPGSIATAAATLLAPQCNRLLLVARQSSSRAKQIAKQLGAELTFDIRGALAETRVVLTATSSGNCIDQSWLRPGSVVVDVAVPTDVRGSQAERSDVLVISGGLIRVPDAMPLNSMFLDFHHGMIPSCLGETMVLGLEGRAECFSLGRNLNADSIMEIGAIASAHGFDFSQLYSFGLQLEPSNLAQYRKAASSCRRAAIKNRGSIGEIASPPPTVVDLAERSAALYQRYINPVLIAMGGKNGFAKTFVRGQGNYLWDAAGRRYLDLVAGFGSLNMGHNHPRVAAAITSAIEQQSPGFVQSAVNPLTAELAGRLVAITPASLELVFFANSGTEAVEAALKLARTTSGRSGLLYCERSYHGKSLGALSVTGNLKYQKPFGPLLPDCQAVRFGDLESLKSMLETRRFAAFIVEPIQAEGGMIVAPDGYLRRVQDLCRATDTLLIVDEVQTGMGRTGDLFAVEREGVEPDIMTLAKSLGGGMMPLGAMLCRRSLWHKAYGTVSNFALHTSTFGGGSLASAAGLAAIRTLEEEGLAEKARQRGQQLYDGLSDLCQRCDVVKEVRGRGLLLGLEFHPLPKQFLSAWKLRFGMGQFLMPEFESVIESIPTLYAMQGLIQEFGIYAQVARSNPLVLRLQPPLTITAEEVNQVLAAVEQVCFEFDRSNKMFDGILAKSTLGKHEGASGVSAVGTGNTTGPAATVPQPVI